jgi:hypothetical protein
VSINPRLRYADNLGTLPCIDPLLLGRVMDRLCNGRTPTLSQRVIAALAQLRTRLTR